MSELDLAAAIQAAPDGSIGIVLRADGDHTLSRKTCQPPLFYMPVLRPGDKSYIIPAEALAQYEVTPAPMPPEARQMTTATYRRNIIILAVLILGAAFMLGLTWPRATIMPLDFATGNPKSVLNISQDRMNELLDFGDSKYYVSDAGDYEPRGHAPQTGAVRYYYAPQIAIRIDGIFSGGGVEFFAGRWVCPHCGSNHYQDTNIGRGCTDGYEDWDWEAHYHNDRLISAPKQDMFFSWQRTCRACGTRYDCTSNLKAGSTKRSPAQFKAVYP